MIFYVRIDFHFFLYFFKKKFWKYIGEVSIFESDEQSSEWLMARNLLYFGNNKIDIFK